MWKNSTGVIQITGTTHGPQDLQKPRTGPGGVGFKAAAIEAQPFRESIMVIARQVESIIMIMMSGLCVCVCVCMGLCPSSHPQGLRFIRFDLGHKALYFEQVFWRFSCRPSLKYHLRKLGFKLDSTYPYNWSIAE